MNVNEATSPTRPIKPRCPGDGSHVHPNYHVNRGQSSNDTIPTAIPTAAALALEGEVIPALRRLHEALAVKAEEFYDGPNRSH